MAPPTDETGRPRTKGYWEDRYRAGGRLWGDEAAPQAQKAAETFLARRVGTVLDIGCGYGRDLSLFRSLGMDAAGVDLSIAGLRLARGAARRGRLVQGHGACLPFRDGGFGGAWSDNLLQLLTPEAAAAVAREMQRVVAPGGVVAAATFSTSDADFGKGVCLGNNTYHHRGHTAHFRTGEDVAGLFPSCRSLALEEVTYRHPDPEDGEHVHTLWFFAAVKTPQSP